MLTVHFEDYGQDFLEWDIEALSQFEGKVAGCRPFQANVWCDCHVMMDSLEKGGYVIFTRNFKDAHEIKYPIKKIEGKD